MTYEIETKNAYRNKKKASAYLSQYVEGTKWARFTMWKQKKILNQFFNDCNLTLIISVLVLHKQPQQPRQPRPLLRLPLS